MDSYGRLRASASNGPSSQPMMSYPSPQHLPNPSSRPQAHLPPAAPVDQEEPLNISFAKGTKRKRLAKACDACHKSKRRCDGTAPCSNCYFATKTCTYTDASGRPVPAPRNVPPDAAKTAGGSPEAFVHADPQVYQSSESSSSRATLEPTAEDQTAPRKRYRSDQGPAVASLQLIPRNPGPAPPLNAVFDGPSGLDPALIRELVGLFFTHRHPHRTILHKPSFSAALSHNKVPAYLLHAICALAAPLSKQPRIRTNPPWIAGHAFALEAASIMFDSAGRLICESNLATAQALCLLLMHESIGKSGRSSRYHGLALQVLETLGVHKPDRPVITPVPSPEFIHTSIERECARRVFWLIHFMNLVSSIFFKTPTATKDSEMMLRLPSDETSFELSVHSTLPEYLYLPAPRTQYASEIGHLIRIMSIHAKIETLMDTYKDCEPGPWVTECEHAVDSWVASFPEHLRFSEDNLQVQLSMFETSSNTGAWSFCAMHIIHASCTLALSAAKQGAHRLPVSTPSWAIARIELILNTLGSRAKYSIILGMGLLPMIKYCHRDDAKMREWSAEHEDRWGVRVQDCIVLERRTPVSIQQPLPNAQPSRPQQPRDPSIGRSLHDMRLENRMPHPDSRSGPSGRAISDADIDPVLHGASAQRNHIASESATSLPSLKSSGLLDSWSAPTEPSIVAAPGQISWNPTSNVRADAQPPQRTNSPRSQYQPDSEASRTVPSTMPVGMAWLANESTNPR